MSNEKDQSNPDLWEEVKEEGEDFSPRDRKKVKGVAARNSRYHSPYKRARNAYFRKKIGKKYIDRPKRINSIASERVKNQYIQKAREMEAKMKAAAD